MAPGPSIWLFALLLLAGCYDQRADSPPDMVPDLASGPGIRVLDVVDGDTITIAGAQGREISVRLIGFDTPETFRAECDAERELGNRATRRLQAILRDAQVIETRTRGVDRYGRLLMRMNLDGRDLAGIMVAEGLAVPYNGGQRIDWCARLNRP